MRSHTWFARFASVALLSGAAVMTGAAPAAAHGSCAVTSPSGGAVGGSYFYASGEITCTSTHTFYSIEVCIQHALQPVLATYSDVACAYSEYSSATGRLSWSDEVIYWEGCDRTGWWRAQVVGKAGTHPSQTFQSTGFIHVCT